MKKYAPLLLGLAARCAHGDLDHAQAQDDAAAAARGQLSARPGPATTPHRPGTRSLDLDAERDVYLHAPPSYRHGEPMPLVLMLHGAGGSGARALAMLRPLADAYGFLVVAPGSRGQTWDAIGGAPGPDVRLIDRALQAAFSGWSVDPRRVAVAGFSDGASYALGLGLGNGDLFCCVLAFSPGFVPETEHRGSPRIFLSHGTEDRVLPIDRCSRRIAPALERLGCSVRYVEFTGPHAVPEPVARQGLDWLLR